MAVSQVNLRYAMGVKMIRRNKIFRRIGLVLVTTIIIIFAGGYIYQTLCVRSDNKKYRPVGDLYEINNKMMHLYTGGSGDATVVFAAGWGTVNPYVDYYPLYDETSKYAKFVVYDKFGYGYSDFTDQPRDLDVIVDEIHELMIKADVKSPYIFVGHSLASLECLRYAQRYPDEVKGIILIDGGNPEFYDKTKPVTFISVIQRQLINFGIARVLYNINGFADTINSERNGLQLLPEELKNIDEMATLLKANNENITDEMRRSQENAKKVVSGGKLGNIPLIIITAGDFGNAGKDWLDSQEKLTEWSNNSKQFIVEDSRHYIHQYHPEIITSEIMEIISSTE
ncbi:MAG: alpha/beta hydrolase [Anaerocolumna sp.]|jgi:pimeloyl-ACP methyl ester carboxylesterase|nr:alpha/beta hydrolase [Anaerocolumna sp.]